MSDYKQDYITYRLAKAEETLRDARLLAANESWNSSINRLYYACYYAVSALLLTSDITTQTHSGLKTQFGSNFVKTGKVSLEHGRLYADLMDWRQKGDYGDMYDFDKETVSPLLDAVGDFIICIKTLINTSNANDAPVL